MSDTLEGYSMFDIEDLLLISEIYGKLVYHHDEEFNVSICSVGWFDVWFLCVFCGC